MSHESEGSPTELFLNCLLIFCLVTWSIGMLYLTLQGPVVLATVVSKEVDEGESISYQLNIRHVAAGQKATNSYLVVSEKHYAAFEPGDRFPIKYARNFPAKTAFAGERFYSKGGAIMFGGLLLALICAFWSMRREQRKHSFPNEAPPPNAPPSYPARTALIWALLGMGAFGGGIISCRHAAYVASPSYEAPTHEYQHVKLLGTRYTPATNRTSALVRLPNIYGNDTVRLDLTPEQHALLYARLMRPGTQNPEVLVAYLAAEPKQLQLADAVPKLPENLRTDTSLGISYNTLGILLCSIGAVLAVAQLTKYFDLANK